MMPNREATPLQERIGAATSTAMENYARKYTAALVLILGEHQIDLGSATSVKFGTRFLLATAGHNLPGSDPASAIWVVANGKTTEERLPILGKDAKVGHGVDVGWVELSEDAALRSGLQFLQSEYLAPYERPTEESLYLAQGLPAELASVSSKTIAVASLGYMTIPVEEEDISYPLKPAYDFALEFGPGETVELPHPKGMSGGGVWSIQTDLEPPVWSPSNARLVAIVRAWRESSGHMLVNRIEHWIEFVGSSFPDVAQEAAVMLAGGASRP